MRLHKLRLVNFRGVDDREIEFASGVTVVEGRNEAGKSTLMEALRFLRLHKSSSRKSEIRAVQPVGRDVGPMVVAELSTGEYRLRYAKRWLKSPVTELWITAPEPEQLAGDRAHDRFLELIAATTDEGMFDALEIIQGQSLGQPELATLPALRRALDHAAEEGSAEVELMAAVDQEYSRYFTATGKPTGDYLRCATEIERLRGRVSQLEETSRGIDELTEQVFRCSQQTQALQGRLSAAQEELAALSQQQAHLDELNRRCEQLSQKLDHSREQLERDRASLEDRRRGESEAKQLAEAARRSAVDAELLRERLAAAENQLEQSQQAVAQASEAERVAREQLAEVEQQLTRARQVAEREKTQRLLDQLEQAEAALQSAERTLGEGTLSPEELSHLEELEVRRRVAEGRWEASAATLQLTVSGSVLLDGAEQPIGEQGPIALTRSTTLEVPGQLQLLLEPGAGTEAGQQATAEAERALAAALAVHGLADLPQARRLADETTRATAQRDEAAQTVAQLCAGSSKAALVARLAALANVSASLDPAQLEAQQEASRQRLAALGQRLSQARDLADAAQTTQAVAQESWIRQDAEAVGLAQRAAAAAQRLEEARAAIDDAAMAVRVAAATADLETDRVLLEQARAEAQQSDAETQALLLENSRQLVDRLTEELTQSRDELTSQRALLADRLSLGIYDQLVAARAECGSAEAAQASRDRAARAVARLRETLYRHRAEAQRRYVGPFREHLEALARIVFGPDLSLDVGPDLRLVSRTWLGVTVPFESLSTGAREQLSLLGRLVCAQLVQPGEGVPVVIDDALGFSDPQRLARLGAVLNRVADTAQVIVLTSQPERFSHIGAAKVVRL